jgi:hypothetical protein
MEEINLCKRPGGCCPVLKQVGVNWTISDKEQKTKGKVTLTPEQLKILLEEATKWVN